MVVGGVAAVVSAAVALVRVVLERGLRVAGFAAEALSTISEGATSVVTGTGSISLAGVVIAGVVTRRWRAEALSVPLLATPLAALLAPLFARVFAPVFAGLRTGVLRAATGLPSASESTPLPYQRRLPHLDVAPEFDHELRTSTGLPCA